MLDCRKIVLVVDANVVILSGDEYSNDKTVANNTRCLCIIQNKEYKIAMCKTLYIEMNNKINQSSVNEKELSFAYDWYHFMENSNRIVNFSNQRNEELRKNVKTNNRLNKIEVEEVLKDIHLIELALKTDKKIVSNDENCLKLLHRLIIKIKKLKDIYWSMPAVNSSTFDWLEDCTPDEEYEFLKIKNYSA